ncbi:hypothetical protein CNMCM8980_002264 [Aspergillus fumigatiaffinis]|nr:hypothetical protein CNMCM5878_008777 [Aspergillus fumigatiaffinis]KAF4249939.1 hypothetical protein CNMCM8980_002264 [Aspergillus fumigatiaffinis]
MAETVQKPPSTHTGPNNPGINSPPKRRPPKLRRNIPLATQASGKDNESNKGPDSRQVSRDTDGDLTSIGHDSTVDDKYISEPESFIAETEPQGGHQRAAQPSARQTAVIDRPSTAPIENWHRRVRSRRGNQQLAPIESDIAGRTVNSAVGAVQEVSSKAISSAGNTAGKALGDVVGVSQGEQKGKDEQVRLRLDLNLDIEVQLKAKIHGDLTLQLL